MITSLENLLLKNRSQFRCVVDVDPAKDKISAIDLSKNNSTLTEEIFSNTKLFSAYINKQLEIHQAKFLIGGYNELRAIYQRSVLFDEEKKFGIEKSINEQPRRLHIGTDIWGAVNTPVFVPIGGTVHSFAFNNHFGDYGATIILQHQLDAQVFYTLYGHLSLADIAPLTEGQFLTRGSVLAHFGPPKENGNWPPHLHFQVIKDMGRYKGDYPGVCNEKEAEKYLSNCPDPDLIVNLIHLTGKA
ncbi:MAG: peptidoglycan DD-metalloendopeptidase family protein [Bacteroidetes bacterium]|nr:peptidoglycan DD-metalloendopeptidase family protein [Bacteroidota bacterium]